MESAAEQHGADRTEPGIHDADDTLLEGLSVDASRPEQPVLREADGTPVRTWRENYPYDRKLRRREYERRKRVLQIELLKLQSWVKETGARIVIVCEGRDAAGKGGTIKRFTERLNPRGARVVALDKPTEKEAGQWYFQRYIAHLPSPGEIVFFDRSWYNRAGVERVMGFCTEEQYEQFLVQAPLFEKMITSDGILLVKFWFSVSAVRAADAVRHPAGRSGPAVEAVSDGPCLARPLGRLHPGQDRDVPGHRHRLGPLDRRQDQRQAARPARGDAQSAVARGVRRQGRRGLGGGGSSHRRACRHPA